MRTYAIPILIFVASVVIFWAVDIRNNYVELNQKIGEPTYGIIQKKEDIHKDNYELTIITSAGKATNLVFAMANRDFNKVSVGDSLSKGAKENHARIYKSPTFHFCCELVVF